MRAPLLAPLTQAQQVVVTMLAHRHNYGEIAVYMRITERTVRFHATSAAKKIPGDLPAAMRCIFWARGATTEVLEGSYLADIKILHRDMTLQGVDQAVAV